MLRKVTNSIIVFYWIGYWIGRCACLTDLLRQTNQSLSLFAGASFSWPVLFSSFWQLLWPLSLSSFFNTAQRYCTFVVWFGLVWWCCEIVWKIWFQLPGQILTAFEFQEMSGMSKKVEDGTKTCNVTIKTLREVGLVWWCCEIVWQNMGSVTRANFDGI